MLLYDFIYYEKVKIKVNFFFNKYGGFSCIFIVKKLFFFGMGYIVKIYFCLCF